MATKSLKGTQTEKNLIFSFANESQAHARYSFFASQAKKDGFVEVQAFFEQTADQEKAHAKRFFKFLEGGMVNVNAEFPAGTIGTTLENLETSAKLEHEEMESVYPGFAETAEKEGFPVIAAAYRAIAVAEGEHSRVYSEFAKRIREDKMFESDKEVVWQCRKCGFLMKGLKAPAKCPACEHPRDHFQRHSDAPIAPISTL
ncbi:rubrerythrin [Porphyromonas sp. HMSC077F02]|uniref:rubrerythrin n=1 Tax=Porphyromonas TaxID=836 RepID=UPI00033B8B21|nr:MULTISPECIES: rubrerythrin family protein [Porphyromonas]OFO51990.1 rubrerythrin [Porphyromonas sp. HMSC077F02]BDE82406.1 rubrerythrin [Porphyromonas somerae]CCY10391.1 rubrerythrin [Porphyromonas sp. CAG:1061]